MADYNLLKKLIIAFLIIYFIGGLSTLALPAWKDKKLIPLYSWFLFDRVPSEKRVAHVVRILEYQGKILQPPLLFTEAKDVVAEPRSQKAREIIQELSLGIMQNQDEGNKELQKLFEQNFLPPCVRYEIASIEYNPIERWKSNQYEIKTSKEFATSCQS